MSTLITPDSLLTLEAYAKTPQGRQTGRHCLPAPAHLHLGQHVSLPVRGRTHHPAPDPGDAAHREDLDEEGIQSEIDAYQPLVPTSDEEPGCDVMRDVIDRLESFKRLLSLS